nr:TusE/DsrC/DsvC family sulfur relay protein [candidate division Zixibacteria bacterium]
MVMRTFTYKGKSYQVDYYGFLLKPDEWDENFAEGMAPYAGIENGLTDDHWRVIRFIRNTFEQINKCPLVYIACKKNDLGLGDLKRLFPSGYLRGACKLSGVTYREGHFQEFWIEEHIVHHTRIYDRKKYETDALGFLINPGDWDENFAIHKASELKMPDLLTSRHWDIIYYLRRQFEVYKEIPTVYQTCEDNNLSLEELERLFPDGYHRGAVKISGLHVR